MNKDIKITKREKLKEVNNDMVHNFYYLIFGRIYNDEHTRYKKFKFVVFFDAFDVQEFFEKDWYDKNDINNYLEEMIFCFVDNISSYDNIEHFLELCKESILNYNKIN